jgi:hypothetical protein
MADRDWAEYNDGEIATMPFCPPFEEELPGDVGVNEYHEDHEIEMDTERWLVKVSALSFNQTWN